jgi:transcriptional regulator with XRE-family HTH domain
MLIMDKLKTLIKASGETQGCWAKRFGIGNAHLSQLLKGDRKPSLSLTWRIAHATDYAVMPNDWTIEEAA